MESKLLEQLKVKRWFKVLDQNGIAKSGSDFKYPLPTANKKGKWLDFKGNIKMCESGYHLTFKPKQWLCDKPRFFEVEIDWTKKILFEYENKICVERCRLIKECDNSDLIDFDIYINYKGSINKTTKCFLFNSSVVAWENSSVVAWENSSVVAWENSSVMINDYSSFNIEKAKINDSAQIISRRDKKIYVKKDKFQIIEL